MISFTSQAAQYATKFVNSTNCHIFLTGKAGTGKTTFLHYIREHTHKNCVVAAPTGIAAINAKGVTLHSLFQLPFGAFLPSNDVNFDGEFSVELSIPRSLLSNRQMNKTKRAMLRELELLIIDEVSMLRADLLDAINTIMQSIRRNRRPFGGIQILFIGDLWQLPPVVKDNEWKYLQQFYASPFFFNALALQEHKPVLLELDKIFRQKDMHFVTLLNNLRDNKVTQQDIQTLNQYSKPGFRPGKKDGYIQLVTHNYQADNLNRKSLNELEGKTYFFEAEVTGEFKEYQFPVDPSLELKENAQVMFIKNDFSGEGKYFNGKIGTVSEMTDDSICVSFNDGSDPVEVERYTWENKRFSLNKESNQIEEQLLGTFSHYPLKLAWAITIHKSQGLTFERAIIDVSKAFAPGQVYVALSRLTSLDGLVLTASVPHNGLQPSAELRNYMTNKKEAGELAKAYTDESQRFIGEYVLQTFNFSGLLRLFSAHVESYNKDEKRSAKQKYFSWAKDIQGEIIKTKEVADKFLAQLESIIKPKQPGYLDFLQKRLVAAKDYFEPNLKGFSEKIFQHIRDLKSEKGVKQYLNELRDAELLFFGQLQKIHKSEALVSASLENKDLSKEELERTALYANRGKEVKDSIGNLKSRKKEPKKKEEKINTRDITLQMFNGGLTIEEIAKERQFTINTIEGHLADQIVAGKVEPTKVIAKEKLDSIYKAIDKLDTTKLNDLKELLPNNFSYGEIRIGVACYKLSQEEKQ